MVVVGGVHQAQIRARMSSTPVRWGWETGRVGGRTPPRWFKLADSDHYLAVLTFPVGRSNPTRQTEPGPGSRELRRLRPAVDLWPY